MGSENSSSSRMRTAETFLRLVPMGLCLSALLLMLKNSQTNDYYGSVSYSDFGGFKYLIYANGACLGYSLFSALYIVLPHGSTTKSHAWTIYFFDQVLTYMILAAGSASTEVLYLAYKGDKAITWSEACESYSGFCHRAKASVTITFGAVACYVLLTLMSSYRLFSTYDSPILFPSKGDESAAFPG